jgi:cephalosporin hydroxylase
MSDKMIDPISAFNAENRKRVSEYSRYPEWLETSSKWRELAFTHKYMYHFSWLGRPIIQVPVDIVATQELIWQVKPDLIIETGIAHGGSLILSASILMMLDYADAVERREVLDPTRPGRTVLGVDIDIRAHNLAAIDAHPLRGRIEMIQGSSVAPETVTRVKEYAKNAKRVMVFLDSNHTHSHVLAELEAYAPLVSKDSYCVVFDTVVDDLPNDMFPDRPWAKNDNPKTAVREYLSAHPEFEVDREFEDKLLVSVAPEGYLRRK